MNRSTAAVLAVATFSLTPITPVSAVLTAVIGIVASAKMIRAGEQSDSVQTQTLGIGLVGLTLVLGFLSPLFRLPTDNPWAQYIWIAMGLFQIGVLINSVVRHRTDAPHATTLPVLLAAAALGAMAILDAQRMTEVSDVVAMHRSAADSVIRSLDPYIHASATNTSPSALSGEVIQGYTYPPLTMVPIVLAQLLFGDARWLLLACWLFFLATVAREVRKQSPDLLPAMYLMALTPGFRYTMAVGWTEPLTVALCALVILSLRRSRYLVPVAIGASMASKQYFALAAPLAAASRIKGRLFYLASGALIAFLTLVPYLLNSPGDVWRSLVANLPDNRIRPNSFSLSTALHELGISPFLLPRTAWLAVIVVFGVVVGREVRTVGQLVAGMASLLGFGFLINIGYQNYWLLCACLVLLAALVMPLESILTPDHDSSQVGHHRL